MWRKINIGLMSIFLTGFAQHHVNAQIANGSHTNDATIQGAGKLSAGCLSANQGHLDLKVKVVGELFVGQTGSAPVPGFEVDDTLRIVIHAEVIGVELRYSSGLSVMTSSATLSPWLPSESILAGSQRIVREETKYVVPPSFRNAQFFTTALVEGHGEYTMTVRCEGLGSPTS